MRERERAKRKVREREVCSVSRIARKKGSIDRPGQRTGGGKSLTNRQVRWGAPGGYLGEAGVRMSRFQEKWTEGVPR
jgi:hypothetical protein